MKKLLLFSMVLLFTTACSSKKDDVDTETSNLEGTWQLTKLTGSITEKNGQKTEDSKNGTAADVIKLGADGSIKGIAALVQEDSDLTSIPYKYEVVDSEFIIYMPATADIYVEKIYYKLDQSGNTMTWTMDLNRAKKSLEESDDSSLVLPFEKEDLESLSAMELKYVFKKI